MPWLVLIVCALGVVMAACATTGARAGDASDARSLALADLEPLIGVWEGAGFLRSGAGEPETRTATRWTIERGFDGRFVRMEFAILREDGSARGEWVGYFTFSPEDGLYHTTWTLVSAGRDFTFHETGSFDPAARALSLVSHQKAPGPDGAERRVGSVFTITGPGSFTVEDTTTDPATGESFVSLRYDLRRSGR